MKMPPCKTLNDIFASGYVEDASGGRINLHSNISREHAMALYGTVRKYKPVLCVEIGMCFAISTLSILTALRENNNGGRLISIDPFQTDPRHEKGIGLMNVKRAGLDNLHELVENTSYEALPAMLTGGTSIDFAYIDGCHHFDYVLLDFFYLDKMLRVDGVVGFNDCGWRAVHKVLKYVQRYRHYSELNVGLPRNYKASNPLFSLIKRLEGRAGNDRYFRKREEWEPEGAYFKRF